MNPVRERRKAFSLMEVVVALMLMATLLTSIILAIGRHRRQGKLAEDRRLAIRIADQLLATWHESKHGIPYMSSGPIPEHRGWIWRTNVVANQTLFGANFPKIGFEIVQPQAQRDVLLVQLEILATPRNAGELNR